MYKSHLRIKVVTLTSEYRYVYVANVGQLWTGWEKKLVGEQNK